MKMNGALVVGEGLNTIASTQVTTVSSPLNSGVYGEGDRVEIHVNFNTLVTVIESAIDLR